MYHLLLCQSKSKSWYPGLIGQTMLTQLLTTITWLSKIDFRNYQKLNEYKCEIYGVKSLPFPILTRRKISKNKLVSSTLLFPWLFSDASIITLNFVEQYCTIDQSILYRLYSIVYSVYYILYIELILVRFSFWFLSLASLLSGDDAYVCGDRMHIWLAYRSDY